MGGKMNDKNPTFQYSILPLFHSLTSVISVTSVAEMLISSPSFRPARLKDLDQQQPHDETPDVGEEGHVGDGPSHDPQELEEKPETQDNDSGEADEFNEDDDEEKREHPGPREEKEVGPQDPGHRPAGADHGNR